MNNIFRLHPQPAFNFNGLVIDNFAGGGGASTGIELGIGRPVDSAINHDPEAVAMHDINHPHTKHFCESVWEVDPRVIVDGRPVDLCWFSPDCKHFSKAAQVRMCGNSVCPPVAAALVRANLSAQQLGEDAA